MNRLLLIVILSIYYNISNSQEAFEGTITYKVTTRLKDENNQHKEYLLNKYGDSLKIHFASDGSFKREYFGSKNLGFDWQVYDAASNNYYAKWKTIDTIYYYSCFDLFTELRTIEEGATATILNKSCKSVIVSTYDPIGKESLVIAYYYSGEPSILPNTYAQFKEGYINQVYEKSRSHILKYEMDLLYSFITIEAIRIEPGKPNASIFELPNSIPMKKW